jgi:hypothetical protein
VVWVRVHPEDVERVLALLELPTVIKVLVESAVHAENAVGDNHSKQQLVEQLYEGTLAAENFLET